MWMDLRRAGLNTFAGRSWPAGRTLPITGLVFIYIRVCFVTAGLVLPVLLIACDRVTVKRCLDNLVKFRPNKDIFPIIVSQVCTMIHEELDSPTVSALWRAIVEVKQCWSVIGWVTKN
jgi:hypothetical protein